MNNGTKAKFGALMLKDTFHKIGGSMDYSQYGGAVLLGVKAPVVKTHGSSKADTVKNTIGQIRQIISSNMIPDLDEYVRDHTDELQQIKDSIKSSK